MDTGRQSAGNEQLDWMAGIIDGEGSLMLHKRSQTKGGKFSLRPIATIANTHKPTIDRCYSILTELGIGPYLCTNRPKNGKYPPQYSLFVNGYKRMGKFLEVFRERLFTKRHQADLLDEFIKSRDGAHPGKPYTPREAQIADEIKFANNSRYWFGSSETLRVAPEQG